MKPTMIKLTIAILVMTTQLGFSFSLDGFVPFDSRRHVVDESKKFLVHFTSGAIEEACGVLWTKDIEIKRQTVTAYDGLKPYLPKIGKRKAEHFVGAITLGDFWMELGYIEVFEGAVMFVRISFARPAGSKWYVKDVNYSLKGDISKLVDEVPAEYKRFIASEKELQAPATP